MAVKMEKLAKAYKDRYDRFEYKVELEATASVVDATKNEEEYLVLAEKFNLKNKKPEDFIVLKSVLCTSLPYVNKNGHAFKASDLSAAVDSGQLGNIQPAIIDWRHNFVPMGNTFAAEIIQTEVAVGGMDTVQKVSQIIVYSVFYSWLFPYEGEKIRSWADKGILKFSMAAGADDVEIINGSTRVLVNPQFMANSIIPPDGEPADENAGLIALAKKNKSNKLTANKNEDAKMDEKILKLTEDVKALTAKLKEKEGVIAKFEASESAKEKKAIEAKLEKLTADLEEAKKETAEKVEELKTAKSELDELKTKHEDALKMVKEVRQAEVEKINSERKEALSAVIEDEKEVEYQMASLSASLSEDIEVVDNKEKYEHFIALFKKSDATGDAVTDAEDSDLTKASKKTTVVASKTTKAGEKKNLNDWA